MQHTSLAWVSADRFMEVLDRPLIGWEQIANGLASYHALASITGYGCTARTVRRRCNKVRTRAFGRPMCRRGLPSPLIANGPCFACNESEECQRGTHDIGLAGPDHRNFSYVAGAHSVATCNKDAWGQNQHQFAPQAN